MGGMSRTRPILHKLLPWAGLLLGILGAGLAHQIGSDNVFNDCATASPTVVLVAGLLGLGLIGLGAFGSWTVFSRKDEGQSRSLVATVSLMTAALLAFATLMPMIASLIIPPCFN
jgi:hypothetical protein